MIKEYIQYLKDNPHNYWFKAKLYGWGWVPVKWQGWVTIIIYVTAILFLAFTIDKNSPDHEITLNVILPFTILTIILIIICYKKGEKPHWQWGLPKNNVILVDENNNEIGTCEKLKAHQDAKLHRAFSIFIFNKKGELLLQQRALEKYHSGGLWTNTVCSHPEPNKNILKSAKDRLNEEMGFQTEVKELFSFIYKSDYTNGLTEHEFDHVFIGHYNNHPKPNPDEVMDYKWMKIADIKKDIIKNPNNYTSWFKVILENKNFIKKITNEN